MATAPWIISRTARSQRAIILRVISSVTARHFSMRDLADSLTRCFGLDAEPVEMARLMAAGVDPNGLEILRRLVAQTRRPCGTDAARHRPVGACPPASLQSACAS
jgi:hypothetical protein